jgi:non-specific protein-tyrosine kinase
MGVRGGTNFISVIEPATTPRRPISPNVEETVLLAAAIGLSLAVGGAFLIEYLDDTVKTPTDVEQVADLPILGTIGRIRGEEYAEKLITLEDPRSPLAEAYRVLRTNVRFSSVDRTARTIMVTSPDASEGKSVTLANLAVVMAQAGLKVVAIDSDLRRPALHRIFGLPNSHGLSNAILTEDGWLANGRNELEYGHPTDSAFARSIDLRRPASSEPKTMQHVQATPVPNLWVLPSGPLPPNPAELLGSERIGQVVAELDWAEVILFDSPPTLAVTDAAVLGARVDGVLVVFEVGTTRRGSAKRVIQELRKVDANVLGVVMNRLSRGRDGYYYQYYYRDYRSDDGRGEKGRPGRRHGLGRLLPFGNGSRNRSEVSKD